MPRTDLKRFKPEGRGGEKILVISAGHGIITSAEDYLNTTQQIYQQHVVLF